MPPQSEFLSPVENDFYEEENPEENEGAGGFRTHNPIDNRFQRQFIHISSTKSVFRKTVEMILCVHGWEDATHQQPMTLIVLGFHLSCSQRKYRYQSVRLWLQFGEDTAAKPLTPVKASPTVVAYAPFVKTARWNETLAEMRRNNASGGTVGADYVVHAEATGNHESEITFTRKYFDRGTADRIVDEATGTVVGTQWYIEQNDLQQFGVEPDFQVAVLLKRTNTQDGEAVPFQGVFDMRVEAGLEHDIMQAVRRFFRLMRPEDDPIFFNPDLPEHVHGNEGKKLMAKIHKENLGRLANAEMLVGLLNNDALASRLEPLEAMS